MAQWCHCVTAFYLNGGWLHVKYLVVWCLSFLVNEYCLSMNMRANLFRDSASNKSDLNTIKSLRILRVLRPLKTINKLPKLKVLSHQFIPTPRWQFLLHFVALCIAVVSISSRFTMTESRSNRKRNKLKMVIPDNGCLTASASAQLLVVINKFWQQELSLSGLPNFGTVYHPIPRHDDDTYTIWQPAENSLVLVYPTDVLRNCLGCEGCA